MVCVGVEEQKTHRLHVSLARRSVVAETFALCAHFEECSRTTHHVVQAAEPELPASPLFMGLRRAKADRCWEDCFVKKNL